MTHLTKSPPPTMPPTCRRLIHVMHHAEENEENDEDDEDDEEDEEHEEKHDDYDEHVHDDDDEWPCGTRKQSSYGNQYEKKGQSEISKARFMP